MKQQAQMAETTGLMLFDAVAVDEVEEVEELEEEAATKAEKQKFPDMCSKINCDDFAEVSNSKTMLDLTREKNRQPKYKSADASRTWQLRQSRAIS